MQAYLTDLEVTEYTFPAPNRMGQTPSPETEESFMRIRQKEIRKSRKRHEESIKEQIKEARGSKKPAAPARTRTRKSTTPAS